ncbi:MAG: GTPase HflX [Chloroflexi bacterium]|nr:GTPase HflX [Chloroflexota bacterium]
MTNSTTIHSSSLASDGRARDRVVRDEAGLVSTAPFEERAILVGVEIQNQPGLLALEDSLDELALLAKTAGVRPIARITQRLESPNPATLIGTGKVEELRLAVLEEQASVVIFDDELSPRQQRELERVLGDAVKVVDRTALILDIFARHARTREGAVQVELAQYEYRLPRLTRAWTHLARQAGGRAGGAAGGVGVRGPGETQLEVDRREIGRRIAFLKQQLAEISKHREHYRRQRRQSALPVIAVVGYTNAGKSTLLNAIADADVLAEDQLFATLDPTTRRVRLPSDRLALFSDTVGFIQKLPTMLVAAFRSTLEEVNSADLLLHVVDISHANMEEQIAAVEEILDDLGASAKPVVVALNKIDRLLLDDPEQRRRIDQALADNPRAVLISAATKANLDLLLAEIDRALRSRMAAIDVQIPYDRGDLVAFLHEHGTVESVTHSESGTHLVGHLPIELLGRLAPYWTASEPVAEE